MPDVNMPKLSDTMEEGTVLEWKKQDGDEVARGEVLAEIESDKASFEIEAEAAGVLHIVVGQGQAVPVGDLIGRIGGDAPVAAPAAAPAPAAAAAERPAAAAPSPRPEPPQPAPAPSPNGGPERVKASPIARRLADELGVDLRSLQGSGPDGRVVKEDVLAAADQGGRRQATATATAVRPRPRLEGRDVELVEPNRMQATIARRMTESKTTVPHFYAAVEVRVDEAVRVRQQLKELVPNADKVTVTDMVTRACAIALTRFPEVNSSWVDGRFQRKQAVNIGLAVSPAQGMGLLVPVVHDVDRKDLVEISIESRQVIERARSGKPAQGDLDGGTFSISNLGMYGVDEFSAIVNPPESAILAVGAIKDVPLVVDGEIRPGKAMRLTLSVDHRVFYGATSAQFLAEVKRLLENPVTLLAPPEA
jgi:pyruvate dehydrogenase E2 component (dihydrolipoamide acetyltransferase)